MNVESVADKLAQDIRSEESLHGPMVKDLAKLAASTAVTEEDFHATFLKALGRFVFLTFFTLYTAIVVYPQHLCPNCSANFIKITVLTQYIVALSFSTFVFLLQLSLKVVLHKLYR